MRMFDLSYEDHFSMKRKELLEALVATEGRTLLCETIISTFPLLDGVSNAETAAAFGADLITLNTFHFDAPFIFGYDDAQFSALMGLPNYAQKIQETILKNLEDPDYIRNFKKVIGRFIGVNLEPVKKDSTYPKGLRCSRENLEKAKNLGFDYVVITANPKTGITSQDIENGIALAREVLGEEVLIMGGKMHGAGAGNIYDQETISAFVHAGADIILLPAPGTVPAITEELCSTMIRLIHKEGALAMTTIGTSQEGASESTIESISLMAKMAGADLQHTGDCGYSGMSLPENILKMSVTMRGRRHAYRKMARSPHRTSK